MELTGKITAVLPLVTGEGKTGTAWKKQDYVLEFMSGQYQKKICFNLWGEKIDQFPVELGSEVKVHFDVESREYNGKYYTDIKAYRVDKQQAGVAPAKDTADDWPPFTPTAATTNTVAEDDLPF